MAFSNRALFALAALLTLASACGDAGDSKSTPAPEGAEPASTVQPVLEFVGTGLDADEQALLDRLNAAPDTLPGEFDVHPISLIITQGDDGSISVVGSPIAADQSALRFERAMQKRRTDPSEYWAFVEHDGKIVYWVPIDPTAMVRANVPLGDSGHHLPSLASIPTHYVMVRLPFFFGAKVSFVSQQAQKLGSYEMEMAPMLRLMNSPATEPTDVKACVDPAPGWPLQGPLDLDKCPQTYEVHGNNGVSLDQSLNIVFLSAGFAEDELEVYRCAVAMMAEKMMSTPPYNLYSDSIKIFRIDLASSHPIHFPRPCGDRNNCLVMRTQWADRANDCKAIAERHDLRTPAYGRAVYATHDGDCHKLDLDVRSCPETAQECQLLWPDDEGLRKMWRVAACAPAFDAVVIVGNTGTWAGGGTSDIHPPVAVTTLNGIDSWMTRSVLLSHEFGHVLGLLDEYVSSAAYSGEGKQSPDFHAGRNLVRKKAGIPTQFPWQDDCDQGVAGLTSYAGGKCFVSCNPHCETCDLPPLSDLTDDGGAPATGAYEGGMYQSCGYFKASQVCKMNNAAQPFCDACKHYIDGLFADLGMVRNSVPHPVTEPPPRR